MCGSLISVACVPAHKASRYGFRSDPKAFDGGSSHKYWVFSSSPALNETNRMHCASVH